MKCQLCSNGDHCVELVTGSLHILFWNLLLSSDSHFLCITMCFSCSSTLVCLYLFILLLYLILLILDWNMDTFVFISETALKLDRLVGEVEDAVSSVMSKNLKKNSIPQSLEVITENYL